MHSDHCFLCSDQRGRPQGPPRRVARGTFPQTGNGCEERGQRVPSNLHPNRQQDERDDALNPVRRRRLDAGRNRWREPVAYVYGYARYHSGERDPAVSRQIRESTLRQCMCAQGNHHHNAAGPCGDRERQWVNALPSREGRSVSGIVGSVRSPASAPPGLTGSSPSRPARAHPTPA